MRAEPLQSVAVVLTLVASANISHAAKSSEQVKNECR